ncbi:substrate-binding periplasmic protein [Cryptosporangium aurantiacum]|uniref:substrate-binding periplasmic protein n=1 Tax=Cryptosporangium aurantiacum TaxID=134849 RepID=UPI0011611865|nr:transporter substrate-binding domain-containing protein [Cryptosporangium aurantiacum]
MAPSPTAAMEKVPTGVTVPLVRKGQLTVCQWGGGVPYLATAAATGGTKAEGFDVELLTLVGQRLGVQPVIVEVDRTDILAAQALGRKFCDLTAGQFFALPEGDPEELPVDYTEPYFRRAITILTADKSLTTLESLRGKRVAVESSSLLPDEVQAAGVQTTELDEAAIGAAINAGQFDAALIDSGLAAHLQHEDKTGSLIVAGQFGDPGDVVFAVAEGNTVLREQVNAALVDAGRNGHFRYAYSQWFAGEPALVPGS